MPSAFFHSDSLHFKSLKRDRRQVGLTDFVEFSRDGTFHLVLSHFQDEVEPKKQKTDK